MDSRLMFEYDPVGDILYIQRAPPNASQESDMIDSNVVVRRNADSGAIEVVEILFFTQWLGRKSPRSNLTE